MKKRIFAVLSFSLTMLLFATSCGLDGSKTPAPSQAGVTAPNTSEPKADPSQKSEGETSVTNWPLPKTSAGTVGEALLKLGVSASNGLTYQSDYQQQKDWDRHVALQKPELQNALKDLLQLPLETDSTIFEQASRPRLCLYAGMLQIGDHQDFYEVILSFPKTEKEETGFQILLRKRFFGNFEFVPATRKSGDSWAWDEKKEYSKIGETVFRIPGFSKWYQTHAKVLQEAMNTGEKGDLYSFHQAQILRKAMGAKQTSNALTLGTLLQKAGYEWETNENVALCWNRGSGENYKLRSTSWTPLLAEYYQKLLQLPVQPVEEEWKKLQKNDPYFELLLGSKFEQEAGWVGDCKLVAPIDGAGDSVLLYEETPKPNSPLSKQVYAFQMDAKGALQRELKIPDYLEEVRLSTGWKQWKIEGFQTWLQDFEKALKEAGELELEPLHND